MSKVEEKIVFIRRKVSKNLTKNTALKIMNDNAFKYLGSAGYGNTGLPVTGLTEEEKVFIMPLLVQVPATHNEFDLMVSTYFHELREPVPAGKGLRLNISTEKKEVLHAGEKKTIDFPANPKDYVLYKRAIDPLYKQCADNLDAAKSGGDRVKFYLHDVEAARKVEVALGDKRDAAFSAYLDIADDTKAWEPLLLVYGINPDVLSKVDQKQKLRELASADGIKEQAEQLEAFEKFIELVKDKDIKVKAQINKLVNAKIIVIIGTSYIYDNGATTVTIGSSEKEAVLWMGDAKNSKDVQIMAAKLKG